MVIFLSYASEYARLSERISIALRQSGHQVFFDKQSQSAGGDYRATIRRALDESELFVFLVSPESVSANCFAMTELDIAQRKWPNPVGYVLPVMASQIDLELVPEYLQAVTILDPQGDLAEAVRREIDEWTPLQTVDTKQWIEGLIQRFEEGTGQRMAPTVAVAVEATTVLREFEQTVLERGEPGRLYRRVIRGALVDRGTRRTTYYDPVEYFARAGREYVDGAGRTCRDIGVSCRVEDESIDSTDTYCLQRGVWVLLREQPSTEAKLGRLGKSPEPAETSSPQSQPVQMKPIRDFR